MNLEYGLKTYSKLDLNATKQEVTSAKNKRIVDVILFNPAAAVTYIQFFDAAAADVTVGTTTPTFVIGIPAGREVVAKIGPRHFVNGIVIAATTTATGNTNPATAAVVSLAYA